MDTGFDLKMYARRFKGKPIGFHTEHSLLRHFRLPKFCEPLMKSVGLIETFVNADLYHATDHYLPLKLCSNYIVTIHDLIFLTAPEKRWEIHKYQAKYVPEFARNSQHVITCSESTKNDIVEYIGITPEKVSVIPWGIDHELFSPIADKKEIDLLLREKFGINKPYFLAVACSVGRKNTPRLLEAWTQVLKKCSDFKLVLVWNPPDEIRKHCDKSEFKESIIFTGRVDDDILRALYQCSECVIYPSICEGFGLPILEAMSCGIPVITSNISSMPEVGKELAYYITPYETESISNGILNFIRSLPVTNQERKNYINHAKKYNWQKCAEQTINIYEKFL